jgi:dTDP-3-amino-3,4,6-trideoxy-alpha-D-glucose transaminase
MNDFGRQWAETGDDVLAAVREVGESGWYVLGRQGTAFEGALARHLGRRHAIGCGNGLDALEIGLRALGVAPGQKVLTTPLSAYATTLAITRAGGVPVFVDVDRSGLIDLDLAERALAADALIRFMVPVHLYGHALDLDRLESIKRRFGLRIVEDCAQAVGATAVGATAVGKAAVCAMAGGARSGDRPVGSVGDVAATSFYPTKNLGALGDGGAVLTDDDALDRTCRALRDYGQTSKYVHDLPGLNSRLDEVHAAVLARAFLPRLAAWTARRAAVADAYVSGLAAAAHVRPFPQPPHSRSVWHLFPVLVPADGRDAFMAHLKAAGVQSAVHYPKLIPEQRALAGVPFEVKGELTVAATLARGEVSLPIHPHLSDEDVARVVAAAKAWRAP